jgi:hypothetical protein
MTLRNHARLLAQAIAAWLAFWIVGLPDYYQQYSTVTMGVACVLLSVAISLAAIALLRPCRPECRMRRAFWLSFYFTLPFAALDALYCGWYLDVGAAFLTSYWYLWVFYLSPWLTFMPTAALLGNRSDVDA